MKYLKLFENFDYDDFEDEEDDDFYSKITNFFNNTKNNKIVVNKNSNEIIEAFYNKDSFDYIDWNRGIIGYGFDEKVFELESEYFESYREFQNNIDDYKYKLTIKKEVIYITVNSINYSVTFSDEEWNKLYEMIMSEPASITHDINKRVLLNTAKEFQDAKKSLSN